MKKKYPLWDTEDYTKKYTSIYNDVSKHEDYLMRITVWLGNGYRLTLKVLKKLNPISDYGRLPGNAFADHIIIPFWTFSETSPTFSDYVSFFCKKNERLGQVISTTRKRKGNTISFKETFLVKFLLV